MTRIYTLTDPRDGQIRYVGKTRLSLRQRLSVHLCGRSNSYRTNWVQSLRRSGFKPEIRLVQEVDDGHWRECERYWIAYFRENGSPLTNLTLGGDGIDGYQHSESTKERIRASNLGKKRSEETRIRVGNASRGRKFSVEARERLRLSREGRTLSEEHRRKIGLAHKGKTVSTETRERLRMAHLGRKLTVDHRKNIGLGQRASRAVAN